jgi:hypothetical protein
MAPLDIDRPDAAGAAPLPPAAVIRRTTAENEIHGTASAEPKADLPLGFRLIDGERFYSAAWLSRPDRT